MIRPELKPAFQKGFAWTSWLLIKKEFSGLYLDRESSWGMNGVWPSGRNLFLYSTHSSWWDPVVAAELAIRQMGHRVLAPMDAKQYQAFPSLRYVGIFGVEPGDGPAVEKLFADQRAKHPNTAIWVTPQGQISPNEVPQPTFKSGLARWSQIPGASRIPVSLHYFLGAQAKRPAIFVRVGSAVACAHEGDFSADSEGLRLALQNQTELLLGKVWRAHQGTKADLSGFVKLC